jgi:proline dehydrogenase
MSLFDRLIRLTLPIVPRFVVSRVARRYIAGPSLEDALRTVRALNAEGAMATVDLLGEEARETGQVEEAVAEYGRILEAVKGEGLACNISAKPTLFGLRIDRGLCLESLGRVAAAASAAGSFLRLDMEDHSATDATLELYRALQTRHGSVGVVLQAMLRRTPTDIARLLPARPNVRLCKGIYREPRRFAWQDPETVRAAFVHGLEKLLTGGGYVGIATHDERLVFAAMALVDRLGLGREQYEFQTLLGVEPELRQIILASGHRLRVYVPYGADWYGYSLRRLRENPSIARHVLRAFFRRGATSA